MSERRGKEYDAEQLTAEQLGAYFQECSVNRALLQDIQVVVPVRPADGINCKLARMLSIWYGEGTGWSQLNDHMGGFIEVTRANILYDFKMNQKSKYLLMIDNDMEPPINLPYLLGRHDKPVVGACCMAFSRNYGPQLCFSVSDGKGGHRFPTLAGGPIPAKGLKEVAHVGTGAILIRRDVANAFTFGKAAEAALQDHREGKTLTREQVVDILRPDIPFYVPESIRIDGFKTGHLLVGEDIEFCNQLRRKGIPMYVDLEAHVGHRKTVAMLWDQATKTDPNLKAEDWVVTEGQKFGLGLQDIPMKTE